MRLQLTHPNKETAALVAAVAVLIVGVIATFEARAQGAAGFVNKTLYASDIQYRVTRSPDNKTLSVLFDNFGVSLTADGPAAPAIHVLPLTIPVAGAAKGATVHVQVRGGLVCPDGASCLVILWVSGQTKVLTLAPGKTSADFGGDAEFALPGADVHQAAVILIAERPTNRHDISATINVDSLDLTIAPPVRSTATKK
jgi:hypothetical protein